MHIARDILCRGYFLEMVPGNIALDEKASVVSVRLLLVKFVVNKDTHCVFVACVEQNSCLARPNRIGGV